MKPSRNEEILHPGIGPTLGGPIPSGRDRVANLAGSKLELPSKLVGAESGIQTVSGQIMGPQLPSLGVRWNRELKPSQAAIAVNLLKVPAYPPGNDGDIRIGAKLGEYVGRGTSLFKTSVPAEEARNGSGQAGIAQSKPDSVQGRDLLGQHTGKIDRQERAPEARNQQPSCGFLSGVVGTIENNDRAFARKALEHRLDLSRDQAIGRVLL